jgi:hypothetical protein
VEHDDFIIHGPPRSEHERKTHGELEQYLHEHES